MRRLWGGDDFGGWSRVKTGRVGSAMEKEMMRQAGQVAVAFRL